MTRTKTKPGKFIVIEGIDGSGKTSVSKYVCAELRQIGHQVSVTHEPGSMIEDYIRDLFKRAEGPPSPDEMSIMFTADRLIHMERQVRPYLASGVSVINDRHKLSTLVYQTVNGADPELVIKLVRIPQPEPDLTIILDIHPEFARERMLARNENLDSYESQIEKQSKMRSLYLKHRNDFGPSHVIAVDDDSECMVQSHALWVIKREIER